jgi:hypothetical protein
MKITIGLEDLDLVVPNEMSEIYRLFQKKVYKYLKIYEATEIVTNGHIGGILQDFDGFKSEGIQYNLMSSYNPDPYLVGSLDVIKIYVDPVMLWSDNRIIVRGSEIRLRREKILKIKGEKEFEDFLEEIIIEPKLGNMIF